MSVVWLTTSNANAFSIKYMENLVWDALNTVITADKIWFRQQKWKKELTKTGLLLHGCYIHVWDSASLYCKRHATSWFGPEHLSLDVMSWGSVWSNMDTSSKKQCMCLSSAVVNHWITSLIYLAVWHHWRIAPLLMIIQDKNQRPSELGPQPIQPGSLDVCRRLSHHLIKQKY